VQPCLIGIVLVSFDSALIVFTTSVVGAFGLGLWLQEHSVIVSFVGEKPSPNTTLSSSMFGLFI
jgi:hypothetical protein